jgi:hypothetical protein
MRSPPSLLPCCCLLAVLSSGCGRSPSDEFDDRPAIPTAPVALPSPPEPAAGTGSHAPSEHSPGDDLRAPRASGVPADDDALPARGPNPTYTYVPVPSPRELPGEKVPTSSSLPTSMPKLRSYDATNLPAGTPVTVPPPPPSSPSGRVLAPGTSAVELKP